MIKLRTRRWAAIFALAALAFAHASMAFAACSMERGMLAESMAMSAGEECDACNLPKQAPGASAAQCIAHCTADLQHVSQPVPIVQSPAAASVFLVPQPPAPHSQSRGLSARPPGAPPHRVLAHSFLI